MDLEVLYGLIVVVFIIVVNIAKAKKQRQKAKEAASPLNVSPEIKKKYRNTQNADPQAQREAPRPFAAPVTSAFEGDDPCHEEQLSGMPPKAGEEGFDPCHGEPLFGMEAAAPEISDADREEAAQELLRGIVLSEILGRRQPLRR